MVNNDNLQKAVELINKSYNILLTTHTRPDGDALGCMAALTEVLTALGKKPNPILLSSLPQWYDFLFENKLPVLGNDLAPEQLKALLSESDLLIILDTNCYSQLPGLDKLLMQNKKPVLVIDHHITTDGLGDVELIDTAAAATGQIVLQLLNCARWPITEKIADCLFAAIATDTGWFQFGNTDSRALRACADLIEAGADALGIRRRIYENFSPERFRLMVTMLGRLQLHFDGRFATVYLLNKDFDETGAQRPDTENLIDECRRIKSVEAAALFVEQPDGRFKVSLRSTGPVDVREIAQKFGGGGHKMASGLYLKDPLNNAEKLIYDQIKEQLDQLGNSR
jgi:phosphoesterase RecJ-like protein